MHKTAAIYARVSSDRQKESGTIASQTAALRECARERAYIVPPEWVFEDDGFSGARMDRPGLEAVRDLAAEGRIEAVLVLSPDRLSRKYAYQVLLLEEFARCGVACEFVQSPPAETPQERLLVQVQGMIAEYERAQMAERSRRGKRHKARNGSPSVLSGAPYGYGYVKRSEGVEARYEVLSGEAAVVRQVFDSYTREQCSMGAIARSLTEQGIPTRSGKGRWDRSVIWAMLRNPAYHGRACYGKTGTGPRQRVTRPLREPGKFPGRQVAGRERPREEWIEIPVPALVSEEQFEQAHEQLEANKRHAATRRTKEPTLLQGMLVCRRCGYAYYRTATRTTKRKLYYYRCLGADRWRYAEGVRCPSRPLRQDRLDALVWRELVRLLEEPALLQAELQRRLEAGRETDPQRRRLADLRSERERLERAGARLVTAYQEELITLDELRSRMPAMHSRKRVLETESEAIESAAEEQERYLRIADTLESFRDRLRASADTLNVIERQKVLRSLVKEVLVGDGEITIRHSIPLTEGSSCSHGKPASNSSRQSPESQGYLLRWGSDHCPLWGPPARVEPLPVLQYPGAQPFADQPQQPLVSNPLPQQLYQLCPVDAVEEFRDVCVQYPVDLAPFDPDCDGIERIVRPAPRSEPVAEPEELRLVYRRQDGVDNGLLDDFVLQCGHPQRSRASVRLRNVHPPRRTRPVRSCLHAPVQVEQSLFQPLPVLRPSHSVHARCRSGLQPVVGLP